MAVELEASWLRVLGNEFETSAWHDTMIELTRIRQSAEETLDQKPDHKDSEKMVRLIDRIESHVYQRRQITIPNMGPPSKIEEFISAAYRKRHQGDL